MSPPTAYYDEKRRVVAVIHGLSDKWISARERHRVKSSALPPRDTQEEAQADLDAYADGKGWEIVPDEPEFIKEVDVAENNDEQTTAIVPAYGNETSLTTKELRALQKSEEAIANSFMECVRSFVDIGNALLAIRDDRLYRDGYATFEAYCRERWDLSKPYATQLIGSARVMESLRGCNCNHFPTTESQTRPLTTIPMEQVGEVWQEAIETAPKDKNGKPIITAKHVDETVKRWKEADEAYEQVAEPIGGFDFESESIKIFDWVRKRAQTWPDSHRQALAKILKQLANEVT